MSEKARRIQRVEKEVRQIVSIYLARKQSGSTDKLISVTNVIVSADLRQAKVYLAMLGETNVDEETLKAAQSHAPEIQKEIAHQLRMKYCPKLHFYNDEGIAIINKLDAMQRGENQ